MSISIRLQSPQSGVPSLYYIPLKDYVNIISISDRAVLMGTGHDAVTIELNKHDRQKLMVAREDGKSIKCVSKISKY